jgi:hypothetical protein
VTNVFYDSADVDVWGGVFGDVWVGDVVVTPGDLVITLDVGTLLTLDLSVATALALQLEDVV